MTHSRHVPAAIAGKLARARRLELWTLFFLGTIVVVMYLVLGSSQAMKSAWIEDLLSLLPPVLFLLSTHLEGRAPTRKFPLGFHRAGSLAFFVSACALTAMGGFLLVDAALTLIEGERPTIGAVRLFGVDVWLGWLMIGALAYSVVPPVVLGRMKKSLAREINDKVLFTDAAMNAADWRTGLAGVVGIFGIAYGLWWADAVAAGFISFSILKDGIQNATVAAAELIDGAPRELDSREISSTALALHDRLAAAWPGHTVAIRETGRYMRASVAPASEDPLECPVAEDLLDEHARRLVEVTRAVRSLDTEATRSAG